MSSIDKDLRQRFNQRREDGWGIGLYRHPSLGWLGGVCAGLAEYWQLPIWVVRFSAFVLFFFSNFILLCFYFAAWMLISKRPSRWSDNGQKVEAVDQGDYPDEHQTGRRRHVIRPSESPSKQVASAHKRVRDAERRITAMERYVTSSRYDLDGEFSQL